MSTAIVVGVALLFVVGFFGGLALWIGARLGAHLVDELWKAWEDHRL